MGTDGPLAGLAHAGPVGVFDGGIGSFDMVRRLRAAYPKQDIIYLADRASFPYGSLTEHELLESVSRAVDALVGLGARSVILASNAPSVTILDQLAERSPVPVLGVKPPIAEALRAVQPDGRVAVLGASMMIDSSALAGYVASEAAHVGADEQRVVRVRADELIELVESGEFLKPAVASEQVRGFLARLRATQEGIRALTLSSTHLPWLAGEIKRVAPELQLFDPADEVVASFASVNGSSREGRGELLCVATASERHTLEEFQGIIEALELDIKPTLITLAGGEP